MAMMKYGRTMSSPKTTDPQTGNRIADPKVSGTVVDIGGGAKATYSSWPEFREMYKRGDFNTIMNDYKARGIGRKYPNEVINYISGKTDKLSEEYDEPIIRTEKTSSGVDVPAFDINYKPGSKMYNRLLTQQNAEARKLRASIPKKDYDALMASVKGQAPEGSIELFSTDETQRKFGATFGSYGQHPSTMKKDAVEETPVITPSAVTTPTEPTKPKKTKVTENVVERVEGWDFKEPKYKSKTIRVKDKSPGIKESGGIKKSSRTVKTTTLVPIGKHNTRERRLWKTYEVGSYKGQDFRGMTEEQLRGLTKQARQDKRGAMFEGDFNYSKAAIKKIKEARKYAGRENVAGLASAQEKVDPMRVYESKVWTGEYKDESGKVMPGKFMKTDESGNLSPLNKVVTNSKGEKIITERENTENKKYDSGFFALKKGGESKNKLYTIDKQYGYAGSKQYEEAKSSFKSSMANATNRNTLQSKIVTAINRQKLERQNRKNRSVQ